MDFFTWRKNALCDHGGGVNIIVWAGSTLCEPHLRNGVGVQWPSRFSNPNQHKIIVPPLYSRMHIAHMYPHVISAAFIHPLAEILRAKYWNGIMANVIHCRPCAELMRWPACMRQRVNNPNLHHLKTFTPHGIQKH